MEDLSFLKLLLMMTEESNLSLVIWMYTIYLCYLTNIIKLAEGRGRIPAGPLLGVLCQQDLGYAGH